MEVPGGPAPAPEGSSMPPSPPPSSPSAPSSPPASSSKQRRSRSGQRPAVRLKCRVGSDIKVVAIHRHCNFAELHRRLCAEFGFAISMRYQTKTEQLWLSSQADLNELLASGRAVVEVTVSPVEELPRDKSRHPRLLGTPLATICSLDGTESNSGPDPVTPVLSVPPTPAVGAPASDSPPIKWQRGEVLGRGAYGKVYLGLNQRSGELMAVKEMDVCGLTPSDLSAMEQEVAILQQLKHPNIVRYLGTERSETVFSIFLEYSSGGSVRQMLEKFGPFDEMVIRLYTRQTLLGLEYLHRSGFAHRDIKGGNILVSNDGTVRLADFGASKRTSLLSTVGPGQTMKGTPHWMAPEVIRAQQGSRQWRKADLWSVGCTVIEMATGQPPFSEFSNPLAAMYHIACETTEVTLPGHLSDVGKSFLSLCLQREPSRRPDVSALLLHPFVSKASPSPSGGTGLFASLPRPSSVGLLVRGEGGEVGSPPLKRKVSLPLGVVSPPGGRSPPGQSAPESVLKDAVVPGVIGDGPSRTMDGTTLAGDSSRVLEGRKDNLVPIGPARDVLLPLSTGDARLDVLLPLPNVDGASRVSLMPLSFGDGKVKDVVSSEGPEVLSPPGLEPTGGHSPPFPSILPSPSLPSLPPVSGPRSTLVTPLTPMSGGGERRPAPSSAPPCGPSRIPRPKELAPLQRERAASSSRRGEGDGALASPSSVWSPTRESGTSRPPLFTARKSPPSSSSASSSTLLSPTASEPMLLLSPPKLLRLGARPHC